VRGGVAAADRPVLVTSWIGERMKTDEGKGVVEALGHVSPADRPTILRRVAQEEAGLATCGFADWLEKTQAEAKAAAPTDLPPAGDAPTATE
jgi:hypothetical protein